MCTLNNSKKKNIIRCVVIKNANAKHTNDIHYFSIFPFISIKYATTTFNIPYIHTFAGDTIKTKNKKIKKKNRYNNEMKNKLIEKGKTTDS